MKRLLCLICTALLTINMFTGVAFAAESTLTITSHPESASVAVGDTAVFKVQATTSATAMSYQWQCKAPGATTWSSSTQSGAKTSTLSVSTNVNHNGYQYRCKVMDTKNNTKYSNAATLTIIPKITTQPASTSAKVGSKATFTVTATGKETLKYQWQCMAPGATSWSNSTQSGATTATLTVSTTSSHNEYQYRCVVTDGNGKKSYSDAATLYVLQITTQPADQSVQPGSVAVFTVAATGKGSLTYQWQCKAPNATSWSKSTQSEATTDILSVTTNQYHDGYQYRCIVTDETNKKVYSNAANLTITAKITTQPASTSAKVGSKATFTVAATGKGTLAYQWQCMSPGSNTWTNSTQSGATTATLTVSTKSSHNEYQYRCVVTDGNGKKSYSDAATLYVLQITTQPADQSVQPGSVAVFTVAATGKGSLTYQWQCKAPNATSWSKSTQSGATTDMLSVTTNQYHDGYQYRCIVTDETNKKVYSNAANLTITAKITTQPESKSVSIGATATFTVAATGNGTLTYQWQCMEPSANTWTDSTQSGNKTVKLSVKTNVNHQGYLYRCVVTDGAGKKAYSDVATLSLCDIPINETYFPDEIFRQFVIDNYEWVEDGILSESEIQRIESIFVDNRGISSLKGIEFFTALKKLACYDNNLSKLDVRRNTALKTLLCDDNKLTELDVSRNTALRTLWCEGNLLSALDVSNNKALTSLLCEKNSLTELDLSNNTALKTLWCDGNKLSALDVSCCKGLTSLICESNCLTELDVSNNTELTTLWCGGGNSISTLDVSKNTALESLLCGGNPLGTLDVSNNTELTSLTCYRNNLTSLDLSNNTELTKLSCYNNSLTSLDLSSNTKLEYIDCNSNELTSLDLRKNTALENLVCYKNSLSSLDMSMSTELTKLVCYKNDLKSLDVSKNTALTKIECYSNSLTALNVSSNKALTRLVCDNTVNVTGAGSAVEIIRH